MRRVALSALMSLLLAGCSIGSLPSLSTTFAPAEAEATATQSSSLPLSMSSDDDYPVAARLGKARRQSPQVDAALATAEPVGAAAGVRLDAGEALGLINAYRKERGLRVLKLDPQLTEAAKAHSRDLAAHDRISHYGSDGSSPWDRVKRAGYSARLAAENVGTGQMTMGDVLKGWKESDGHDKNLLLPDAEHAGLALVYDGKTEFKTFWTLVVGAPL